MSALTRRRLIDPETYVLYDAVCTNCDGRMCMDCVLRHSHEECVEDCPHCCPPEGRSSTVTYTLFEVPICDRCGEDAGEVGWTRIDGELFCHRTWDNGKTCEQIEREWAASEVAQ